MLVRVVASAVAAVSGVVVLAAPASAVPGELMYRDRAGVQTRIVSPDRHQCYAVAEPLQFENRTANTALLLNSPDCSGDMVAVVGPFEKGAVGPGAFSVVLS